MKLLVACEYSGTVRDAFSRKGWDAWSCDLLPTESELTKSEGKHYQGDIFDFIGSQKWDLLIGHPPCNYISYAGMNVWNERGRVYKRLEALKFFADLWEQDITYICLENPKSCASPVIAKYSQEIQPYYWGDPQLKTTWLWLKNLPLLTYEINGNTLFEESKAVNRPEPVKIEKTGKARYFTDGLCKNAKDRAHFWTGVSEAMADQWTKYIINRRLDYERELIES